MVAVPIMTQCLRPLADGAQPLLLQPQARGRQRGRDAVAALQNAVRPGFRRKDRLNAMKEETACFHYVVVI